MRFYVALALLALSGVAHAATIDFEFVSADPLCGCYLIEVDETGSAVAIADGPVVNMDGHVTIWEFTGNVEPEYSLTMPGGSQGVDGIFHGGTFSYDTATNIYSNPDLSMSHSVNTEQLNNLGGSTTQLGLSSGFSYSNLTLDFAAPLDTIVDGDVIKVDVTMQWHCELWYEPDCYGVQTVSGETYMRASVTAVPIPAAAWLFSSALAGLGWLRRKQTA